jgi:branched-chain amino acid transport system substrate-binding protein
MAQDEVNQKGGVLGKKLRVTFEDDQCNAAMAVNTVNKLISENVVALIGPTLSATIMGTEQIIKRAGIPCMAAGTSPKVVELGNPYVFRIRPSDTITAKSAAKFAVEKLEAKKVGILFNNDEFGTGARDVMQKYLKSINISAICEGHNTGDKDMTGQLIKMKTADVNVIIVWTHEQETAITGRQLKELGINIPVIGSPASSTPQTLSLMDKEWIEGWYSVTDLVPTDPVPNVLSFVKKYQARYKMTPELNAAANYGAVLILADAMKRAKSTDGIKLQAALMKTKNLQGVLCVYYANDKGEMVHNVSIAQVKDKVPQLVAHISE